MIQSHLIADKISSNEIEAFSMNDKSCFGEKVHGKIEYSLVEALFLVQEGKMKVLSGKKTLSMNDLLKKAKSKDKRINAKLSVFTDLRKKGYIIKTALKFGADFRVYNKGFQPGEEHARWLLYAVKAQEAVSWQDFAAKNRIAHSTKKNLLIAIVDEENDVSYYEVSWQRP